jgi:hypothetical protein
MFLCLTVVNAKLHKNPMFLKLGPFVMCSVDEISQAERDYQLGQNGFEGAQEWNSFIVREDDNPIEAITKPVRLL